MERVYESSLALVDVLVTLGQTRAGLPDIAELSGTELARVSHLRSIAVAAALPEASCTHSTRVGRMRMRQMALAWPTTCLLYTSPSPRD